MPFIGSSLMLAQPAAGGGGYTPNAINFYNNGIGNNYLSKSDSYTGISDGSTGSISFWVKFTGAVPVGGDNIQLIGPNYFNCRVGGDNPGDIFFDLASAGFTNVFSVFSNSTVFAVGSWYNVLAAWNTNFTNGNKIFKLYINNTLIPISSSDGNPAFTISYSGIRQIVPNSSHNNNIKMSEIWFAPNQFIDFAVSANRAKFYSSGSPISLGSTGAIPTGSPPILYLKNAAASAGINSGTGGNFTINGTITDTTPP